MFGMLAAIDSCMKHEFSDFKTWDREAQKLGWVHTHDEYVVLDDAETGECIGEFDSNTNTGWIVKE